MTLLAAAGSWLLSCSAPEQPSGQPAPPTGPDTEAGRPVADAANLPPPSGDPQDDAPSVDVPATNSPLVRTAGTAFTATANGQTWVVDSVAAFSGPGLTGTYEELTMSFQVGQPGQVSSRLVLRLPFTPENVANVPISIPLDEGLRAELSGHLRGEGTGAQLWDSGYLKAGNSTGFSPRSFSQPRGRATIEVLDRAGRVLSGQVDVTFTADDAARTPVRIVGSFKEIGY